MFPQMPAFEERVGQPTLRSLKIIEEPMILSFSSQTDE